MWRSAQNFMTQNIENFTIIEAIKKVFGVFHGQIRLKTNSLL